LINDPVAQLYCLMKYLLLLIFTIMAACCYGQVINGNVFDKDTKLPVSNAIITLGGKKTITNTFGEFHVTATGNDSLKVSRFGYKRYATIVSNALTTLRIELEPAKVELKEVVIHANRRLDFKKDSAANRLFYSKQFNYKGPKVMDAFLGGAGNPLNNTSQILSIDVVTLIRALTKKSTAQYKFNKVLLRDEQADFVNQKFNRGMVSKVTALKSDTLELFMVKYRPAYKFTKTATEFDMINYIKESYQQFKKDGFKGDVLFAKP
jgi:hypothetical protein